jgi:hypothetical protein
LHGDQTSFKLDASAVLSQGTSEKELFGFLRQFTPGTQRAEPLVKDLEALIKELKSAAGAPTANAGQGPPATQSGGLVGGVVGEPPKAKD